MTQAEAFEIMKTGANVFLTGEPGSGKTFLVDCYAGWLRAAGLTAAITASTGIAATHLGGMTIHSWSGIGVRAALSRQNLEWLAQNRQLVARVKRADVLILDEISMLSARTFGLVDQACRYLRNSPAPFGGMQVVLVGDFFQLPPVVPAVSEARPDALPLFEGANEIVPDLSGGTPEEIDDRAQFAYTSPTWEALAPTVCYLSEQHRQEDPAYLEVLGALRARKITDAHVARLTARVSKDALVTSGADGITKLFPHNVDVDRLNAVELQKLPDAESGFLMTTDGRADLIAFLERSCLSPFDLKLKPGARVMFTKNNTESGFVNGTTGVVTGFHEESGFPYVETKNGDTILAEPMDWVVESDERVLARITQVPLRLAWAITVHKSQGMSLDAAAIDLRAAFEYGQGYVALSRVRTLAGLRLAGFNRRALEVHPEVAAKDIEFRTASIEAVVQLGKQSKSNLAATQTDFVRAHGGSI